MQGCLRPVDIRIPKDSLLWPGEEAAVVGGNVLTSQRVTDVILKCFKAAAASQVGLERVVSTTEWAAHPVLRSNVFVCNFFCVTHVMR